MVRSPSILAVLLLLVHCGGPPGPGKDAATDAGPAAVTGSPVLYFSDLASGPSSGNGDTSLGQTAGEDGAIVTVWGAFLGSAQGSSQVYCNGAPARVYYWGDAVPPQSPALLDNGYTQMQVVEFQVAHTAAAGAGGIHVVVHGEQSNDVPFTVQAGAIYFARRSGSDTQGDGSWARPFASIPKVVGALAPGDIGYIGDGVEALTEDAYSGAVNLGTSGEPGKNKALVAYPGATVHVGNSGLTQSFANWVSGSGYAAYWTLAKFVTVANQIAFPLNDGFRVVGNVVSAPDGNAPEGCIEGTGNDLFVLGNEVTACGSDPTTKLYHPIYISGARADSGPQLPTESNREIAWNYLHDNIAHRGINIYNEDPSSALIQGHTVHDNVIVNQSGDGILIGAMVVGQTLVYNNLLVNAGLGPDLAGETTTGHACLEIDAGVAGVPMSQTAVLVFHNTFYGCGDPAVPQTSGVFLWSLANCSVEMRNNIIDSGQPYFAQWSDDPATAVSLTSSNNLWFGAGPAPSWDVDGIGGDPLFVDAQTDYRLQAGSPAIDQGSTATLSVVKADLDGVPRPQGPRPDIGAYERAP